MKKIRIFGKNKFKEQIVMKELKTPWELFGVECGEGWYPLIEPILQYIQSYNKDRSEEHQIVVYQIKEKWGTLQLEIGNYPDELAKMMSEAQKASETTCEKCGAPGSLRNDGWYRTLCDKCFEERMKKKNI